MHIHTPTHKMNVKIILLERWREMIQDQEGKQHRPIDGSSKSQQSLGMHLRKKAELYKGSGVQMWLTR